ncbi:hypothetical protein F5051DRAFT_310148, partial [Lentinula edodes]
MVDTDNAKSKREFKKLSKNMGDRLDREKGRNISELSAPDFKHSHSTDLIRQKAVERERSREEAAQEDAAAVANGTGVGGVGGPGTRTIKRMQFTFSVNEDQHSAAGYTAQPMHVDKPDLKPSAEFSVGKRARGAGFGAGTASVKHSTNAASSVSSTSTNAATVAAKPNDHAHEQMDVSGDAQLTLTQRGRKTSSTSSSNASRNNTFTNTRDAGTLPTTIRFPPLFSSDFGPAALLYPSPTLTTHMNYGEDLGLTHSDNTYSAFNIPRPTIELPLDELLRGMD